MSEEEYSAQKMQDILLWNLPHNKENAFCSKDLEKAIPKKFLFDLNGIMKSESQYGYIGVI